MPTSGDSAPFSSVLDHYGGFAPTRSSSSNLPSTPGLDQDRIAYLRRNSGRSTQSNASGSRPTHSRTQSHLADTAFTLSSPINTPSVRSSSSSLRHTADMLKAGIFPPGLRRQKSRGDSSSDGSHYDDDESEEHGFRVESGDPFGSAHSQLNQGQLDIFTNALDSPDVPLRRSSQHSSLQAKGDSNANSPEKQEVVMQIVEKESASPTIDAASPATITIEPHSPGFSSKSTPPKKSNAHQGMTRTLTDDSTPVSTQKELDLERALALAGERDPNRPKTLKEARAFAKERARLRSQAKEVGDLSSSVILDSMVTQPMQRDVSLETDAAREEISAKKSPNEPSLEWRGHNRQVESISAPEGEEKEEGLKQQESARASSPEKSNAQSMKDLQSAVGEALQDMSFSSSTATDDTLGDLDSSAILPEITSTMKLDIPTSRGDVEEESGAMSVTSFTSAPDFVFAAGATPRSRTTSFLQSTGHDTDYDSAQGEFTSSPLVPTATLIPPLTPNTITDVQRSSHESSTFVPHNLHTQQRSTAPNKIARLDIYGKTIPWPPAFHPAAIIEQRRLAPWERARSYAHYCNDLTSISTGLQVWIDMVQRPVHRNIVEPATPVKKHHLRGEATDHSGYAASVRSDATFPMRGDGARAKELVSHIPAVINDSPPNLLPKNIPYPILVQQAGRSLSSTIDDHSASPLADRNFSKAGFFTNLGRKSSTRRTPGSGSMSSFAALSSSASNNTIRTRGKQSKTISSPMSMTSSPSIATIKSGMMSHESSSSSPSAHSTNFTQPSSPSVAASANRAPMGPRAPAGLALPEAPAKRRGSAASTASFDVPASVNDWTSSPTNAASAATKNPLSHAPNQDNAKRSPILQQIPTIQVPQFFKSSDSNHSHSKSTTSSSRRSSHQMAPPTTAENEAVDKLSDVLPDAERSVLLEHLRKAGNNDLLAIGSYLQENALSEGKNFLR